MRGDISRSEQKRRIKQIEQLVIELSNLPVSLLGQLPCTDEIVTQLKETVSLKGGARKRQLKYITKLLCQEPVEEIFAFMAKRRGSMLEEKRLLHDAEYLRDSLLDEAIEQYRLCMQSGEELTEDWPSRISAGIVRDFPGINELALKTLARNFAATHNRKYGRELFRLIHSAQEQQLAIRRRMEGNQQQETI